jgi:hypothetical protein
MKGLEKKNYYLFIIITISYSLLTFLSPKGLTGVNFEIYAESKSFIFNEPFKLNENKKYLGYDQANKNGIIFSSHPPGISIINIPSTIVTHYLIEPIIKSKIKQPKKIFREASKISVYLTNIILFFLSFLILNKNLKLLDININKRNLILIFFFMVTPLLYFNNSGLRLSCLTTLMIFLFNYILRYKITKKKKNLSIIFIITFLLTISRESNYIFFFVPFIYFLFFLIKFKKIDKEMMNICLIFLASMILSLIFLSIKNYYLINEFGPFTSRKYFDPLGPLMEPGYREKSKFFSYIFSLNNLIKQIFNLNYGLISFYFFNIIIISSFFLKKINNNYHFNYVFLIFFTIFFTMFIFHGFLWFNKGSNWFIGNRYLVPYINVFYLISIINIFAFREFNLNFFRFVFLFAFLEHLRSIILILTSARSHKKFNSSIKFIDGHLMQLSNVDYLYIKLAICFVLITSIIMHIKINLKKLIKDL